MALTADWLSEAPQNAAMRWIGCSSLSQSDMLMSLKEKEIMPSQVDNVF